MNFELIPVEIFEMKQYRADLQEAFQKGFEDQFGRTDEIILPEQDIEQSLNTKGAIAYKAIADGVMTGGAVVIIDEVTQHNHLDLLFVKYGTQNKGVGRKIWFQLEKMYPDTRIWKTCTPYFEKRNIYFYLNICGFHITKFFDEKHPMPGTPENFIGDGNRGMFEFENKCNLINFSLLGSGFPRGRAVQFFYLSREKFFWRKPATVGGLFPNI